MALPNVTTDYMSVFEEVSKYNVHLNIVERLWAVRAILLSTPFFSRGSSGSKKEKRKKNSILTCGS